MTRDVIIAELQKFFSVKELVCKHTYEKFGAASWQFLDTDYLHTLLVIRRDILKVSMVCNTTDMNQRGLRCNMCPMIKEKKAVYLSAHILGKAGDFTVLGMSAEDARKLIRKNADKLPCPIRMESEVNWLHFDVLPQYNVSTKVYEFKG